VAHRIHAPTPLFAIQPLTQPMPGVVVHRPVSSADRAEAKVVAPATQGSIEVFDHCLDRLPVEGRLGHQADRLAEGADSLARGARADKGPAVLGRGTPADGVPQEIKATGVLRLSTAHSNKL